MKAFRIAILTLSDKGARGEREDERRQYAPSGTHLGYFPSALIFRASYVPRSRKYGI